MSVEILKAAIRDVPDFPRKGILFKDITPLLGDPGLFAMAVELFAHHLENTRFDKLAVIESRGFLFGAPLAMRLGVGMALIRKKGKLPYTTIEESYDLEYGTATVEAHVDAVKKGERVVVLDDLLATGGTAIAAVRLVEKLGGEVVEVDFLIELAFLKGRDKLGAVPVFAPIIF